MQIDKLTEIAERFHDVNNFSVVSESSSGIGQSVSVSLELFENSDTKIDITDVSNW
jgi:hypothetical protein